MNETGAVTLVTLQMSQCSFSYFSVISLISERAQISESMIHNVITMSPFLNLKYFLLEYSPLILFFIFSLKGFLYILTLTTLEIYFAFSFN